MACFLNRSMSRSQEFPLIPVGLAKTFDVCVAETSSGVFPDSKAQCFFPMGFVFFWDYQVKIVVEVAT